jgi:predicted RNA-binding protein Jag
MNEATQDAPAAPPPAVRSGEKRAQVEKLLTDILKLMDFPAKLDFQDAADGGIAVAVHFQGEVPAAPAGKRNYLVDSIQFLVNKVVNRPNTEKRWVSLGIGGFPEAKPAPSTQAPPAPKAARPAVAAGNGKATPHTRAPPPPPPPPRAARSEPQEHALEVEADPVLDALGRSLAEKSAKLGRYYAVTMMSAEDRARLLKAGTDVQGVRVTAEGEDYLRRLLFVPQKPSAMPKKQVMPDYPDDEE